MISGSVMNIFKLFVGTKRLNAPVCSSLPHSVATGVTVVLFWPKTPQYSFVQKNVKHKVFSFVFTRICFFFVFRYNVISYACLLYVDLCVTVLIQMSIFVYRGCFFPYVSSTWQYRLSLVNICKPIKPFYSDNHGTYRTW